MEVKAPYRIVNYPEKKQKLIKPVEKSQPKEKKGWYA